MSRAWTLAVAGEISSTVALLACAAMAVLYVAILYSPTVLFRLQRPTSLEIFFIRRFVCAAVSSLISLLAAAVLLRVYKLQDITSALGAFGIRTDHNWQAVVYPLSLTSLMYAGSFVSKSWLITSAWNRKLANPAPGDRRNGFEQVVDGGRYLVNRVCMLASSIMAWRNLVVAPITEELVFRACMISLLLCGGFSTYNIIFFSPVFFSLAHLNHLRELYVNQDYNFLKALQIVCLQLGYTVVFGWYASFLFIRTGNIIAPTVAHIFCNTMGFPVLYSTRTKGVATAAFAAGFVGFVWLFFPLTKPSLYNKKTDHCRCWHAYC